MVRGLRTCNRKFVEWRSKRYESRRIMAKVEVLSSKSRFLKWFRIALYIICEVIDNIPLLRIICLVVCHFYLQILYIFNRFLSIRLLIIPTKRRTVESYSCKQVDGLINILLIKLLIIHVQLKIEKVKSNTECHIYISQRTTET